MLVEAVIGAIGALVILLFVFGTLPAVLMPIVVAIASILNTFTLVWALTYVTDVSIIVQFLIALVGLGVAIDYALLMIFRFRDELRDGNDVERCARRDDDPRRPLRDRLRLHRRDRTARAGRCAAAARPLDGHRRHADPRRLGARVDHAAAGAARRARHADQQRSRHAEALRRPRPSRGRRLGPLGALRASPPARGRSGRPCDVAALAFAGTQLNTNEAQLTNFPGTGTAIAGRADARRRRTSAPA